MRAGMRGQRWGTWNCAGRFTTYDARVGKNLGFRVFCQTGAKAGGGRPIGDERGDGGAAHAERGRIERGNAPTSSSRPAR